jgi:NTP pyrophosphatase (non-canonical NTP hydrolase)
MSKIELNDYQEFVKTTISKPSSNFGEFTHRLYQLEETANSLGVKIPEMLTAANGLCAEAGGFTEIVKKIVFQGKPLDEDNIYHMKRELGDICWYLSVACTALNISLEEVLVMNVEKLSARYPEGFDIIKSEVRKDGDI